MANVADTLRPSHFAFWQHDWRVVAVEHFTVEHRYTSDAVLLEHPITKPRTRVLRACSCGALRTQELAGHWSLEQVKGEIVNG